MRLLLGLMWLLHWLPLSLLGRIGKHIGNLLFLMLKERRNIALTNLRMCFPDLSDTKRNAIAKEHFQYYARAVLERGILWWASEKRLRRLIAIEPSMPVDLFQSGPTIILCPHFVCLEVAGLAISMATHGCSVYTSQRNRLFDEALRKGRSRFNQPKLFSRADGIKPIIRAMRAGLPFFMLPDLDFGAKDAEFVPFFGNLAATLTAPARIATATGAKVVPVVATFLPNYQGWKVTFYSPWENYPGDDIAAATRRMNEFIEARVLEAPAEYWWTHKRFKTRLPGEPGIY
jgi:Kdo2-lipid IVA lauroyltransferase/acyltransferase